MGSSRRNNFKKALHHLKSNQIDEKLKMLSEIPTNNTTGIYIVEPESSVQDPDIPGDVTKEVNFLQDDPTLNGRDTSGLFDTDETTILTIEPPGDTSYILGPMMSMWYAWGNFSTIGYVRQSDRRMVDMGRITGQVESWDGSSNFTSYGQLTLQQAVWFRDQSTIEYRAFYPGPPSNPADEYGRYLGDIISEGKPTTITPPRRRIPPEVGGFDPNIPPGEANPKRKRGDDIAYGKDEYGRSDYAPRPDGTRGYLRPGEFNKGNDGKWYEYVPGQGWQRIPSANNNREINNQIAQSAWPSGKDAKPSETTPILPPWGGGPIRPGGRPYENQPGGSKYPMAKGKTNKNKTQVAHYEPEGQFLSEDRKRILKDIKKPYVLPEQPKVKYKIKPGASRTINSDLMKKAEVPTSFKPAEDNLWGKYERDRNERMSQEKMNEILDHLGGSDHFWEYMTEKNRPKVNDIMYSDLDGEKKKGKIVRREELKGDTLLFIADENGKKGSILQSELSIKLADEFNKELFEKYFKEQEKLKISNDTITKITKNKNNKIEKSIWRNDIRKKFKSYMQGKDIKEGMTTDGFFYTNLPSTGEETLEDLSPSGNNYNLGSGTSYSGNTIVFSGGEYDPGPPAYYARALATKPVDTLKYDTVAVDVLIDSIGSGEEVGMTASLGVESRILIPAGSSSGTYYFSIPISDGLSSRTSTFYILQAASSASRSFSITNIRFLRRNPANIFISLDSPEATAFIRTDPAFAGLSEEEKKKKLQEMFEAGDEYLAKMFGDNFPGTGLDPKVGEAGDTPGVETQDIDYGEIAQVSEYPSGSGSQPKYQTPSGGPGTTDDRNKNMRYDPHMKMMVPNIGPGYSSTGVMSV